MSYYSRYRKRGNGGGSGNADMSIAALGQPDAIFDLGKNKRVTVRQFRNINLIDIREYYMDNSTGEMKPGKKGISLTEDLYDEFLRHRLNIDDALRRLGSKRARTKTVRLLSDDEEEDEADNANGSSPEKKKSKEEAKRDKREKSKKDEEVEEPKKKKPAPPTLLPHEEKIRNLEMEANAAIIVPSNGKPAPAPETSANAGTTAPAESKAKTKSKSKSKAETQTPQNNDTTYHDDNSTDEEFAKTLEAEMNRADDDESEEE